MLNLKGKVAIVTGGASGIGRATVEALAMKGVKVVIADYTEDKGKEVESKLKDDQYDVLFIKVDTSNEESVKNLVSKTVSHYGQLDIMINNAGIGGTGSTHELSYEDYHKIVAVNQDGIFFGSKYAIIEMLKTGGGSIINTSSILGHVGQAGAFSYNATKGAIELMTKSLAIEYANEHIRVNAVYPGYVESGMVNREALGEMYDGLIAKHPIGRLGEASEIAHAMVFLCENEFVTGSSLMVDGGFTAQ